VEGAVERRDASLCCGDGRIGVPGDDRVPPGARDGWADAAESGPTMAVPMSITADTDVRMPIARLFIVFSSSNGEASAMRVIC
jgi:hypothetical protein